MTFPDPRVMCAMKATWEVCINTTRVVVRVVLSIWTGNHAIDKDKSPCNRRVSSVATLDSRCVSIEVTRLKRYCMLKQADNRFMRGIPTVAKGL